MFLDTLNMQIASIFLFIGTLYFILDMKADVSDFGPKQTLLIIWFMALLCTLSLVIARVVMSL